ncbi:MAG: DNA polymerase/3'-5' exonuclease PolX [Thermoanaerobaculia bacterium]|nr:DNA polymerase/3'-5' exonuclease PolX [Thermoanaerobaculia bacterium]
MNRDALVRILRETAALLELEGANVFRVRAYENAARTFEGLAEEPQDLLEQERLAELPGVGPGLVQAVAEVVHTGRMSLHDELRRKYPAGLLDLFRVGGLGPKRIRVLHQELGVGSPADLERACRAGKVAELAGFGAKSQARILEGLAHLGRFQERHLLSEARPVALTLLEHLRAHPDVVRAEVAGSLRRWRETIGDLDFVAAVAADRRQAVATHFAAAPGVQGVESGGETKVQIRLAGGMLADLRMVEDDEYAPALHHFTGSKEHNIALRARAKQDGITVNEYGLFRGDRRIEIGSEAELFERLGLHWIPPERREGGDEIELARAGPLPALVELDDLRGTLHVHTTWSDGTASLAEMARAAARLGWEYLGIADHSRSAAYAGGLTPERVREQWEAIDEWNAGGEAPHLFKGSEVDILVDGALDFDDELLLGFDYVVASVHSRFKLPQSKQTARIVRALSHPCVTFLGHPTGRLLLAREGYDVDLDAVLDAAQAHGVVVEVNASPHRLDLDWRYLHGWLARGCVTSIHPDAHSPYGLGDVAYGVGVARKAGARSRDVLNTGSRADLERYFTARRERARKLLK